VADFVAAAIYSGASRLHDLQVRNAPNQERLCRWHNVIDLGAQRSVALLTPLLSAQ
jgi:hypothetical protein